MKRFLTLLICSAFTIAAAAQTGNITLKIVDKATNDAVIGVVLEVSPAKDVNNKRYYTTNIDGTATIPSLKYGEYTMLATYLGYADLSINFTVNSSSKSLGTLKMKEKATRIDTIVKEVKSLRASQHGDTLSYNAGAFKVTTDADVEGLLKKMPGITINNGTVEAQGETVQKVFVDGKEFFGEDVNTAIKSLPAEAVDRIEVFNKLSDQAEFSGMDDGEGYKAINIVTKVNMRQGQFGKMYAGYGYQPTTDAATSKHKYTAGGNLNFFQNDSRISVIALFNNINQQNFSFEDILGVNGSTGGRRGFGQYMVRPQNGVALVNSIGLNYSDTWGRREQVKFQGSYFFNNTNTTNYSTQETWYEDPSPEDTLVKYGDSETTNNNHRLSARLDWKISRNQSLMSRTSFSFQGNNPTSLYEGYQYGESGLLYLNDYSKTKRKGYNFNEFLQYRLKLGKPGRTLTIDGRFSYRTNDSNRKLSSNEASAILPPYDNEWQEYFGQGKDWHTMQNNPLLYSPVYQHITAPTREYQLRASMTYNEPISPNSQFSFQYRVWYEDENKDQQAFYTDAAFSDANRQPNLPMTNYNTSGYTVHRLGPGFRYSKNRNTVVANVYYQRSSLVGDIAGGTQTDKISRTFNDFTYFAMLNYAFNKENSVRIFFRSWTNAPSITQLQNIFDVSSPQYLSIGNKNLSPSFTHRINFHYIHSNLTKGRTFMWMFSLQNQQDYISSSTLYCPAGFELNSFGNVQVPENSNGEYYKPQRITSHENMSGYWNLRTHVSLGLPLSFMKCNLNIRAGVNYSIIPTAIYASADDMINHRFTRNDAKNIGYDASVTLGSNISENIDFTLSWDGTYNQAWNTYAKHNGQNTKNNYFTHSTTGTLKWVFWKGFTFTASCSYVQNLGFTDDYDENYLLCNLYLGKKIFRNKRGEIQIGVNDVANQNTSFIRTTGSGYTQNLTNSAIGRYFSIQFVYNLRHFGKRGSKQMKDYDYKESKSSVGMSHSTNSGWRGPRR